MAHVGQESLEIVLTAPESLSSEEPFKISITVKNTGEDPIVFKRHWKWAENTWYLEVEGPDGSLLTSSPALFDIPAEKICSYFIPLQPDDEYSTGTIINGTWPPSIDLPMPGKYKLRLVYVSEDRPREKQCTHGGVPIRMGRTKSNWSETKVVTK